VEFLTHALAFLLGLAAGAYGWYRWGATLKTDAEKVRQMKL
jgi:hypothetical protein